jgi:hypothetical protein
MLFKVSTFTLKAPPDLDFDTFFHLVDNTTRNSLLKQQPTAPASLYLYSSRNQTTTSYSLTICDADDGGRMTDVLNQLIEENPHDFHTMTAEAWGAQAEYLPEYEYGDLFKLPIGKKKENLIVSGQTNDGKITRTILYDIIRARHGDDSSRVLRFEKVTDSEDGLVS